MADPADALDPGPDVTEIDDRADTQVPWRVFVGVGMFISIIALIYGLTAYEEAGSVLLTVAGVLGLWTGFFLWNNLRRSESGAPGHGDGAHPAVYLPEASPWPFGIGLGLAVVLNGLLIGSWFLVPGGMVLALSLAGFARQSRHRR